MLATYRPIIALLAGTAFLLAGSGLHGLLLAIRGQQEGFSTASLGYLGTAWAIGFIGGCYMAPRLVRKVGHIRAFACFAACLAIVALSTGIFVNSVVWIVLRAVTGFVMAGAFMVIESWLNERASNENRGTVFGLYMMVTNASMVAGQLSITASDVMAQTLFLLVGIFFCAALIPTAVSSAQSPQPLQDVKLDLNALYRNSPVAFVGCFAIGIANGAWGTLGAVYAAQIGVATTQIALIMCIVMIAGAFMQLPIGRLSDRTDRRFVLAAGASGAGFVAVVMFLLAPRSTGVIMLMTAAYGGLAYTLYSLAVAHANDHADASSFAKISGGLLLLYGFGTMLGPILAAIFMESIRPEGIFLATALAHFAIAGYAMARTRKRAPVPVEDREAFTPVPAERAVTPEALRLDPRAEPQPENPEMHEAAEQHEAAE
ncbi:MFS transporter [Limoniibacter endophyticus]|uniref:MFS transporter n=1 Tax=Limoniibacter endophyticus TaxID=1565040 RepID=A0A8J3GIH1_9HYPH|nr:MFS transporter [Limoniibacter endophyticus]GHC77086.1 MFS transporter [Limoniibacter endophyticus]